MMGPHQWRLRLVFLIVTTVYQSLSCITYVTAHARWVCPQPRNPDTGIKTGPCGSETNVFGNTERLQIQPGPLLVQWEESIHHTGAPFRIALSQDGTDDESCVLIDHIPHFDTVTVYPTFGDESTYTLYTLSIDVPDVRCDSCSLHLANPMTDKIGDDGAPNGVGCTDPLGTCFSVYHSCTLPITILGSTPRSEYICPNINPSDWPTSWKGDSGQTVDVSTMGTYRRESATWDQSFLLDVGENYRSFNTNTTTMLSCTNTELFPTQVDTAPSTPFVPVPPTNVPSNASPAQVPIATTSNPTNLRMSMLPTTSPVVTSDAMQVQHLVQRIFEMFRKFTTDFMSQMRSIF